MDSIIKNLNYSAEETNDILASVSTKAGIVDLEEVKQDVNNLTNLINTYMQDKDTKLDELEETINSLQENLSNFSINIQNTHTIDKQELEEKISDLTDKLNATIERITALETSSSQTELGGSE